MKKIIFILVVTILSGITISFYPEKKESVPKVNDMCLVGIYQDGFVLQEAQAGEYRYELYTTSKGIEVWKTCTE